MTEYPQWKRDLPSIPFDLISKPLMVVVEFYKEHVSRDMSAGRLRPFEYWRLMRGLLISGAQTYAAICLLLADKRPKRLMLQGSILCRSLLETLANVLALSGAPKTRTRVFMREAYKNCATRFRRLQDRYGQDPKWTDYLNVYEKGLKLWAGEIRLSRSWAKNPDQIQDRWPTPGVMINGDRRRKLPPFIRGSRRAVLKEVYDYHYGSQSEQAHQRATAVAVAMLVDNPENQWNPGHGESDITSTAMLFLTCILAEIEVAGKFTAHPKLREVWTYLRDLGDEARDLLAIRYRRLLQM